MLKLTFISVATLIWNGLFNSGKISEQLSDDKISCPTAEDPYFVLDKVK